MIGKYRNLEEEKIPGSWMIRGGFSGEGELWLDLEEGAYDWNGCKVGGRGKHWFFEEEVWPESIGTDTGMSQASLGSRDQLSLPERSVL